MRDQAGRERNQRDYDQRNSDAFSETLAPLLGLGDQECGKEEREVDQDPVCFGDAELNRTGPERREC
ncbi:MAG TPA: hypothetical protein VF125_08085 [Solirubrobacterales bacterium]